MRSPWQLAKKVLLGWPSNLARAERDVHDAYHWRGLFQGLCRDGLPSWAQLEAIAHRYSYRDPLPAPAALIERPLEGAAELESELTWPPVAAEPEALLPMLGAQAQALAQALSDCRWTQTAADAPNRRLAMLRARVEALEVTLLGERELVAVQHGVVDHLEHTVAARVADLATVQRELKRVRSSRSWRWTRPLRRFFAWRRR